MNALHCQIVNRGRERLAHFPGLAFALLGITVLAGCNLDAWKEEYRGVDLIANRGFSAASFTDSYIAGATPVFDYVNYEEIADSATYGGTTGLPTAPGLIYRLELVNLLPDGDFELVNDGDDLGLLPFWTVDVGAILQGDNAPGDAITGMSAYFDVGGNTAAYFNLRLGLLDSLVYPGAYHLNLNLRRATDETRVNFDYGNLSTSVLDLNGITWESDSDPDDPGRPVEVFPNDTNIEVVNVFPVADDTEQYFYVGAPNDGDSVSLQQGHIDDVRIGRYDILPHVARALGPATLAGSLPIFSGTYLFSVYVKSEIDSAVTPTTPNAFRSGQITLGANDAQQSFAIVDELWTDSEWKKLSLTVAPTDLLMSGPDVVTLWMTVTSNYDPMVGRILIAAPTFELVVQ